jgi:hypothetical protein
MKYHRFFLYPCAGRSHNFCAFPSAKMGELWRQVLSARNKLCL